MGNSVIGLLYLAKQNRIDIRLEDGRLQLKVPKNADKNLLEEIKKNKEAILDFLNSNNTVSKKYNKITKSDRSALSHLPLSYSQERLWIIDQLEGSVGYHIPAVLRLTGKLDKGALRKSLEEIVNRHEVLRTVYKEEEGSPRQEIKEKDGWNLEEATVAKEQLEQYIAQKIKEPFKLEEDYMLRATLVEEGEEDHVLIVTMHHIASDGWSMPVIIKEVASLYRSYSQGKPVELKPLELQYADYAIWQKNYLQGEELESKLKYWKEKLSGVSSLELPLDYQRPQQQGMEG
ncbi:MAG: condensation domain-containing protein, partial [Ginsengibacter sp.]